MSDGNAVSSDALKKQRQDYGLSVPQAARQVMVSERTWRKWESDQTIPPGAYKLFRLLNDGKVSE